MRYDDASHNNVDDHDPLARGPSCCVAALGAVFVYQAYDQLQTDFL